jgi:hypothetical protein
MGINDVMTRQNPKIGCTLSQIGKVGKRTAFYSNPGNNLDLFTFKSQTVLADLLGVLSKFLMEFNLLLQIALIEAIRQLVYHAHPNIRLV